MDMSDFTSAYTFFDHGISYLRKNAWKNNYNLSLELHEAGAKSSLVLGDILSLQIVSEQVLKFARSFEDKLNILYITISALAFASKIDESVEMGLTVLSQLGEDIPSSLSKKETKFHIQQTQSMLSAFSDKDLLNYRFMTDSRKLFAMKFLAKLEVSLQMIKPAMQPIVTLKMVQLTLAHGLSPMTPIGFAYFGALLTRLGDAREGYRYAKIARGLLEKINSKEVSGEVIAVSTEVVCFVDPVQTANEFHSQGHIIALAAGDVVHAMLNILFYSVNLY